MGNNIIQDIKTELQSLMDIIHTRIELEKGIGIDVVPNAECGLRIAESKNNSELRTPNSAFRIGGKAQRLLALKETVLKCRKCGLCTDRKNVVFGSGNPDADLMFVGEAPGYEEDVQGEPFVGKAGQLLTKMIEEKRSLNMRREDVYIANVLKCRPPGNRSPRGEEIILCLPHLAKQIEIISPKIICALGAFAAQTLLDTKEPIGSLRGKFYDYQGIKVLPTYHPAYLLRNQSDKAKAWDDMLKIRDMLSKIKEE